MSTTILYSSTNFQIQSFFKKYVLSLYIQLGEGSQATRWKHIFILDVEVNYFSLGLSRLWVQGTADAYKPKRLNK